MRTLWVSLVKFPPLCTYLGEEVPAHCGWLYSSAKALLKNMPGLQLGVIVYSYGSKFEEYHIDGITYYLVPSKNMSKIDKQQWVGCKEALSLFQPDLIHIHGTEHSLAKAVCMANEAKVKTLANIQGLAGPYTRYAEGGLSFWDKLANITPLDFYRNTFLLNTKRNFRHRAACENYVITQITDIVGRTQWDHDHVMTINPKLNYHFMNETLRDSFYEEPIWRLEHCKKHTVFVSNSGAPLKGAHQVLKALAIVIRSYPETEVNFCGFSVLNSDFKSLLRFQGYNLYLRKLVKKLGLEKNVNFLGNLTESEMKQAFLDANVYVMPSAIENSPNSLCEAQILGVPTVASYCGGTPALIEEGKTGYMYRYEEIEMLSQTIMRLYEQKDFAELSSNERQAALARHDREANANRLVEIYRNIVI
ncbi:glycosyltransferase [Flammeovirga sp. MY04]|uniref:glycosyltransferase family 4 protein n=1 Tax=Flammeovirga sp. MY04 TaxID=1191459 RepID=UPI000824A574|nr:glycosyltransferase [Flammeovirga sp. MY04]ANQ47873.2 glycosyltransferase [Flammeovirga sp. MY04]